ncbi:MAG: hypothetical protein RMM10_13215, partial [Anaerolineae bacterium]|uniref:rolling circle replication-associated protein n=1 Tax=Thermoflexus sp. TaxID=1969742 RepID=UPI0025EF5622
RRGAKPRGGAGIFCLLKRIANAYITLLTSHTLRATITILDAPGLPAIHRNFSMNSRGGIMDELMRAWAEFLVRFNWEIFYTQTFQDPVGYPRLAMERLVGVVRSFCLRYGVGVLVFVVAEEHKLGSYHAHAILSSLSPRSLLSLKDSLRFIWLLGTERYGIARAESIDSIGGVTGYITKYMTKRMADYDFYRIDPLDT